MGDPFSVYNSKFSKKKKSINPELAWEEGLRDNADDPDNYYESHNTIPRMGFFIGAFALIFLGLAVRLGILQLAHGAYYRGLANSNHIRTVEILAPRGIIYDSQNEPLLQNVPSFELVATPRDLPKGDLHDEIARLAALVNVDPKASFVPADLEQQLLAKGVSSYQDISVTPNLSHDTALLFETHASEFPGFSILNNPVRHYSDPLMFSHVIGYPGKISEIELADSQKDGYQPNDYIGKTGLELSYEKYLRGTAGAQQVEVDASGAVKSILGEVQAKPGNDLHLNIDAGLQRELYNEIISKNGNKKAAAIAINPQTGQILALVSLPGFDNNLFAQKISETDYQALATDPEHPLFNRAIAGVYPPGSTIKPVMASAALQEGVVTPTQKIVDNGDLVVGSYHFHGWKPGGLGPMDVRSAIAWSSDIYFYTVGGGQQALGINGLGIDKIAKYDSLFGMGQKLGIDLQGEAAGLVGSPQERQQRNSSLAAQQWFLGDTYHESIGQGDMEVTPLQDVEWIATVANGGTLYRPYIVDKITDSSGKTILQNKPQVIRSGFIDPANIQIVREGMRQTVLSGTAKVLQSLPISSAGKTGTAQFDAADPKATHAWFAAFAPYENPQIAIVVLIEAGGEGSVAATPVVKNTLQWWATNRYLKKP